MTAWGPASVEGRSAASMNLPKQLIVCADDFGRDVAVNQAVEAAYRDGILTTASLMVAAPAAADAAARARRLAGLRVGLHLVLADGYPVLPTAEVAALVGRDGAFEANMVRAGFRFFLVSRVRHQLAAEIRAQFAAFRATGLALDHVNGHKHVHLHPTVARLIVEIGRDYGLKAVRLPAEPVAPLRRAFPNEPYRTPPWRPAVAALRRRLRRAGLAANDQVFGIAWSGFMVEDRVLGLLTYLPDGVTEIYFHPSTEPGSTIPGYRQSEELAALLSPLVRRRIAELGIELVSYGDLAAPR